MYTKTIASFFLLLCICHASYAQHSETEEHYALLTDAAARNDHAQVITQYDWFLDHAPD